MKDCMRHAGRRAPDRETDQTHSVIFLTDSNHSESQEIAPCWSAEHRAPGGILLLNLAVQAETSANAPISLRSKMILAFGRQQNLRLTLI